MLVAVLSLILFASADARIFSISSDSTSSTANIQLATITADGRIELISNQNQDQPSWLLELLNKTNSGAQVTQIQTSPIRSALRTFFDRFQTTKSVQVITLNGLSRALENGRIQVTGSELVLLQPQSQPQLAQMQPQLMFGKMPEAFEQPTPYRNIPEAYELLEQRKPFPSIPLKSIPQAFEPLEQPPQFPIYENNLNPFYRIFA